MNSRVLSLILATVFTLQSAAWAQGLRTDGIGDQQIARAQREMAIVRHDLLRLKAALDETEAAIRQRQANNNLSHVLTVGTAAAGLSIAALAATTARSKGKFATAMIALQTALSATMGILNRREAQGTPSESADKAVRKARQEILALRASGTANDETFESLAQLDQSLETLQESLEDYRDSQVLSQRIHLAGIVSQTAGTAMSLGLVLGFIQNPAATKNGAFIATLLMSSGNIAALIQSLTPDKAEAVLKEITYTRAAVEAALASL